MHVSKTVETPQGTVQFEGELSQEEADVVIKLGLNLLFQSGTFNLTIDKEKLDD